MRRVVLRDCGLDALTVALAFAYFETLVLRGAINKANREEEGVATFQTHSWKIEFPARVELFDCRGATAVLYDYMYYY